MSQLLNVSLDSPSPLISYTPAALWRPLQPSQDPDSAFYANSSTASITGFAGIGGQVQFSFNGTGIWVFGAKRDNHGFYNVSLDSGEVQTFNGLQSPNAFQQVLYSATGLTNGPHQLTISNAGPMASGNANLIWFDVDWITYEQPFSEPTDSSSSSAQQINTTTFSPSDTTAFTFTPSLDQWPASTFVDDAGSTITTRTTTTSGATASLNFTLPSSAGPGSVGIFGPQESSHGAYKVTLTQLLPSTQVIVQDKGFNGFYGWTEVHEQMLFYQTGLTPGASYQLEVSDAPSSTNQSTFAIEYVRTWSTGQGSVVMSAPSTTTSSPSGSTGGSKGSSSHTGAIVGAVVGGLLGLALIAACLFLFLRRRRQQESAYDKPRGNEEGHLYTESTAKYANGGQRINEYAVELPMHQNAGSGINMGMAPNSMNNFPQGGGQTMYQQNQNPNFPPLQTGILSPSSGTGSAPSHHQSQYSYSTSIGPQSAFPYPPVPSFPPSDAMSGSGVGGGESVYGGMHGGYPGSIMSGPAPTMSTTQGVTSHASAMSPGTRNSIGSATTAGFAGLGAHPSSGGGPTVAMSAEPMPVRSTTSGTNTDSTGTSSEFRRDARLKQIGALTPTNPSNTTVPSSRSQTSLPLPSHAGAITEEPEDMLGLVMQPMNGTRTSPVRYERDLGLLEAASPPAHELIMPPEYEDARQPWEARRD